MADLLGSILGQMEKPPCMGEEERKKAQAQKKQLEKIQQREKEQLNIFRTKSQKAVSDFIKDAKREKYKFKPMDKVQRAILHEVAEIAGLTSFSFGEEEVDRYVMVWKKEFAPLDDELAAYRNGEEWDPEKAKEKARLKKEAEQQLAEQSSRPEQIVPQTNYREKYERLIGREAAKDAAISTQSERSYGFVSSENKRDRRTIEEVMADSRARKKLKAGEEGSSSAPTTHHESRSTTTGLTNHDRDGDTGDQT